VQIRVCISDCSGRWFYMVFLVIGGFLHLIPGINVLRSHHGEGQLLTTREDSILDLVMTSNDNMGENVSVCVGAFSNGDHQ